MHGVAALLDALLPVLHEVAQGEQGVVAHGDPVLSQPGFHGHQHDARVELLLIDLKSSQREELKTRRERIDTHLENLLSTSSLNCDQLSF